MQHRTAVIGMLSSLAAGALALAAPATADVVGGTSAPITITHVGNADPYPATVSVSGAGVRIADVDVTLEDYSHTFSDDVDVLLVSPAGTSVVVVSDACGDKDFVDHDLRFDDEAAGELPTTSSGSCGDQPGYRPTSYEDHNDTWPAAHPGPHATTLSAYDGENPNGSWYLFVSDDTEGDAGAIEGGFTLAITTDPAPATAITARPPARTTSSIARFRFRADEPGATFQCRLDARPWTTCSSPRAYKRLKPGHHVFRVRARDAVGQVDPTPARADWRVVRRPR